MASFFYSSFPPLSLPSKQTDKDEGFTPLAFLSFLFEWE